MKGKWKVTTNPGIGYGVMRVIDTSKVIHSGNVEVRKHYPTRDEAQAEADRLNEEDE